MQETETMAKSHFSVNPLSCVCYFTVFVRYRKYKDKYCCGIIAV